MGNKEIKRYRRLQEWDYSKGTSLTRSLLLPQQSPLALPPSPFGRVVDGKMQLSELGQVVNESLEAIPRLNLGILLLGHVVMPDHVHFNCHLVAGLDEPLRALGRRRRA